jgi:hypothetical protein
VLANSGHRQHQPSRMLSAIVQPERAARPAGTILDGAAPNIWRALRDASNRSREAVTSARIARALTAARLHDRADRVANQAESATRLLDQRPTHG